MTGVLPIALEDATKALQVFLHSGKEYICLMQLHGDISEEKLFNILKEFTGEIYQKPPLRASVKREIRKRKIYNIEVLEIEGRKVLFKVSCQAGTYIRKLCFDIGEALKVGAHMKELRRVRTGPFTENEKIFTLHQVFEAVMEYKNFGEEEKLRKVIRPIEECFEYIPLCLINVPGTINLISIPPQPEYRRDIQRYLPLQCMTKKPVFLFQILYGC
ncbi:MAG: hypothetical protein QXP78_01600 [Candidatus Bathyarchaeia archaeon]